MSRACQKTIYLYKPQILWAIRVVGTGNYVKKTSWSYRLTKNPCVWNAKVRAQENLKRAQREVPAFKGLELEVVLFEISPVEIHPPQK
jgi:hypothetical protein